MANLLHVLRALSLHEWFFNKIEDGNHQLIANYAISDLDEDVDEDFKNRSEKIQFLRTHVHTMKKLIFFAWNWVWRDFFDHKGFSSRTWH